MNVTWTSRCLWRVVLPAAASLVLAIPVHSQDLVLIRANVLDVTDGGVMEDATVVIRDGTIESMEVRGSTPSGMQVIDVQGMYVSPGLMDAHVHIGSMAQARRALESGITTARSMGAANYADVGLRELAAEGYVDIPELLAAGYHVRPQPGRELLQEPPGVGPLHRRGKYAVQRRSVRWRTPFWTRAWTSSRPTPPSVPDYRRPTREDSCTSMSISGRWSRPAPLAESESRRTPTGTPARGRRWRPA